MLGGSRMHIIQALSFYLLPFLFRAVQANVEKTVFLAPPRTKVPSEEPDLDDLGLERLSPLNHVARTHLNASFPTDDAPLGTDSWFFLENLNPGQRYEVRVCWLATVCMASHHPCFPQLSVLSLDISQTDRALSTWPLLPSNRLLLLFQHTPSAMSLKIPLYWPRLVASLHRVSRLSTLSRWTASSGKPGPANTICPRRTLLQCLIRPSFSAFVPQQIISHSMSLWWRTCRRYWWTWF